MGEIDLSAYQWKNRLLLLFVPEPSSDAYVDQWQSLYRAEDALSERDLLVWSIFEHEVGDAAGEPIEEDDATSLRRQFKIKTGYTAAILIGKDGKEKRRLPMPADVTALLKLIDSMPMRQQEMRDNEA